MKRPLAFVIEDQASLSTLYEDALRLVGYDVIAVRDGLQALNKLETNEPPAFIILDINLPGLSGRDLHQHIRKHSRYNDTPVMILTANSVMANTIRPEITQKDHLFIKPISMKALQDFAKMMRPGKDGVPDHLAKTQKIPPLPLLEDEENEEETVKTINEVLAPDDSLKVDTSPKTDTKLESKEHKAIITPNDKIVDTQTGQTLGEKTGEAPVITDSTVTQKTEEAPTVIDNERADKIEKTSTVTDSEDTEKTEETFAITNSEDTAKIEVKIDSSDSTETEGKSDKTEKAPENDTEAKTDSETKSS